LTVSNATVAYDEDMKGFLSYAILTEKDFSGIDFHGNFRGDFHGNFRDVFKSTECYDN
jgi:hypothetical protein